MLGNGQLTGTCEAICAELVVHLAAALWSILAVCAHVFTASVEDLTAVGLCGVQIICGHTTIACTWCFFNLLHYTKFGHNPVLVQLVLVYSI